MNKCRCGKILRNNENLCVTCEKMERTVGRWQGKQIDYIQVLDFAGKDHGHYLFKCQCECGNIIYRRLDSLKRKRKYPMSCGCKSQPRRSWVLAPISQTNLFEMDRYEFFLKVPPDYQYNPEDCLEPMLIHAKRKDT